MLLRGAAGDLEVQSDAGLGALHSGGGRGGWAVVAVVVVSACACVCAWCWWVCVGWWVGEGAAPPQHWI